jgi:hypothetical protein
MRWTEAGAFVDTRSRRPHTLGLLMKTSLSTSLVVCGTVLIISAWAGVVAEVLAMGRIMASRSDLNNISLGAGEPLSAFCAIAGTVMIVFACWNALRRADRVDNE